MRLLEAIVALLVALGLHSVGVGLWSDFPRAVDLFLIIVVLHSLGGRSASGLLVGLAAGLATDALTGGLYGLYGFADTILGYGGAVLAQRLVVRRLSSVMFLLAVAAATQQAILAGLALLLMPGAPLPDLLFAGLKVGSVTLLGAIVFQGRKMVLARIQGWRRQRGSRLR